MPNTKYILFIMPFGKKTLTYLEEGKIKNVKLDFDKRYKKIKKKFEDEHNKIYRADMFNGIDIYSKMYKAIKVSDVVVADITGLNPNVMYELGARHALKDKQTIMFSSDLNNMDIPFDIITFKVHSYEEILKNLKVFINSDTENDSPILKELSSDNTNKSFFEEYRNEWSNFKEDYDKLGSNEDKINFLKKHKEHFHNSEQFLQMFALETYKQDENDLENLTAAISILKNLNPTLSNNHETLGLACSLYRKKYEITKNENDKSLSFDSSRRFISLFRTNYSISSYTMHLLAEAEQSLLTRKYIEEEMKRILFMFNTVDTDQEPEYNEHTERLINAMKGEACNYYNQNETSTSSIAYFRAIKNYNKMKEKKCKKWWKHLLVMMSKDTVITKI